MGKKQLKSKFTWVKGQRVWYDWPEGVEKRGEDYLNTVEHKAIKKLNPRKWGADGAVG